jgi:hypothetical protein
VGGAEYKGSAALNFQFRWLQFEGNVRHLTPA